MAKNILLTGATGFIGSHVLHSLLQNNYQVVVLLRPSSDLWRIREMEENFSSVVIPDALMDFDPVFAKYKIDCIIHTATEYGREKPLSEILLSNVIFPARLLEAGIRNGIKRIINTDSFFGKYPGTALYLRHYTASKEILLNILKEEQSNLRVDSLRLEHPFGENDAEGKFVSMLVKDLQENKEKIPLTEGSQRRDFIYVKDVANAFIKVLEQEDNDKGFNEYQVGTGQSIPLRHFVQAIADQMQSSSVLVFGDIPAREGEIKDSKADTVPLNKIGWLPAYDLQSAIRQMITAGKKNIINKKT